MGNLIGNGKTLIGVTTVVLSALGYIAKEQGIGFDVTPEQAVGAVGTIITLIGVIAKLFRKRPEVDINRLL